MNTVEQAIDFIHSRPKGGQKDSLSRMRTLLAVLDNPQNELPVAIHITGTNGKGSVATMVSNILRVAGYKTGLFISPYITDFRERIQINNTWISESDLLITTQYVAARLKEIDQQLAPDIPTEFEVLTAIMLVYFSKQQLDAVVVEVGIGGLFDSTNVLSTAKVAVITSVGLDHQVLLGQSIAEIATQKAGIIHNNMAVVVGELPLEAQSVIQKHSQRPLIYGQQGEFDQGLPGQYQIQNTATAVATIRAFNDKIASQLIRQGLNDSQFSARFEELKPNVFIDGAHNYQGLIKLVEALNVPAYQDKTKTLIIGSLMDKNVILAFDEILQLEHFNIALVPFSGPNGRHSMDVDSVAERYNISSFETWESAYANSKSDMIIFTGSLYFVSEVRRRL